MSADDAVRRLIALYAFALDDRDFAAVAAMLADDCVMAVGEATLRGRSQIVDAVSGMQSEAPGRHLLGPSVVTVESGRASAWTDMVGIVPGPDGSQVVAGTWRYHDRLALHDDRWVFTHRYLHTPAQPLMDGAPALPSASSDASTGADPRPGESA